MGVVGGGVVGVGVGRGIVVVLRVGDGSVGTVVLAKTVGNERKGILIDRSEHGVFVCVLLHTNNYCNIHFGVTTTEDYTNTNAKHMLM